MYMNKMQGKYQWRHEDCQQTGRGTTQESAKDMASKGSSVKSKTGNLLAYKHLCSAVEGQPGISGVAVILSVTRQIVADSGLISDLKRDFINRCELVETVQSVPFDNSWFLSLPLDPDNSHRILIFLDSLKRPTKEKMDSICEILSDFTLEAEVEAEGAEADAILSKIDPKLHLESIINNSSDAILLIDGSNGRIIYVNPYCYKKLGYDKSKGIAGFPDEITELIHDKSILDKIAHVLRCNRRKTFKTELFGSDEQKFHVEVTLARSRRKDDKHTIICIAHDITELSRYQDEIIASESRYQSLSEHMRNSIEEERKVVSLEVHDVIGGALSGMLIELDHLKKVISDDHLPAINKISQHCLEALVSARNIATGMRPSVLDKFGVLPALEWLATSFTRNYGIPCFFTSNEDPTPDGAIQSSFLDDQEVGSYAERLTPTQATHVFRITQEALTNILKHSKATHVRISANSSADCFELRVFDDGIGMAPKIPKLPTTGLFGMKERARCANGTFSIKSSPGKGTVIIVKIAINNGECNEK